MEGKMWRERQVQGVYLEPVGQLLVFVPLLGNVDVAEALLERFEFAHPLGPPLLVRETIDSDLPLAPRLSIVHVIAVAHPPLLRASAAPPLPALSLPLLVAATIVLIVIVVVLLILLIHVFVAIFLLDEIVQLLVVLVVLVLVVLAFDQQERSDV
jgi:hypothetical protein